MIFQSLDDKGECVGVYSSGRLDFDSVPDGLTHTWEHASFLDGRQVDYAKLYCEGKTLDQACPEHLLDEWHEKSAKLKAFLVSFRESKVSLSENCFFDLVPQRFLMDFCEIKNKITEYVFETHEKPKNYDFLASVVPILAKIKQNELDIDEQALKERLHEFKVRQFVNKLARTHKYIDFNLFGTKTGRLSTKKGSFPIMTMDKTYRKILKPKNDCFVELDFNAAELRTLLALSGMKQPQEDLHEWNIRNVFGGGTRDEAKKRIFAWLYNPSAKDLSLERIYDRSSVVKECFTGEQVTTFFDRTISCEKHYALNYIIQSTTSDLLLKQMVKVDKILQGRKSFIAFPMHDSLVIDFVATDQHLIKEICACFGNTELGAYGVNLNIGKNFGEMKKYDL
jgi:hypothetical protein